MLNELRKEIIDKKIELNILQSNYQAKVDGMKIYLADIDKIQDCILKKEYYFELKKKEPRQKNIDHAMIDAKRSIAKQLSDFQL